MKKFVALALALVLVFSIGVPSFAVTADEQSTSLQNGWGSVTSAPSYPTGYSSSWFYRIAHNLFNIFDIQTDLKSGWSDTLTPTGFSGSFYAIVRNNLKTINSNLDYLEVDVESISSKLSDIMVDTGKIETATSLYLNTINSSLLSLLDIVPDIDSISSSAVSIKTSVSANSSLLTTISSYLAGSVGEFYFQGSKVDGTWESGSEQATSDFYQSVGSNLFDITVNSELFEDTYLEKKNFEYLDFISQGLLFNSQYNGTFSHAVTNSLSSIGQALTLRNPTSFDNPFSSNGKTSVNTSYGVLGNMVQHMNHQSGFLARLAFVLADDEEIRLHQTLHDSKTEVVDFVGSGITSSNGSSLSLMSGITDGIGFANDFNEFFSMPDVGLGDIFKLFYDTSESLSWFTEETASNIDSVPATYSREPNPQTEIVTSYYEDRQAEFTEKWGALIG